MSRQKRSEGLQRVRTLTRGTAALALFGTGAVVFVAAQSAAQAAESRSHNKAAAGLRAPAAAPSGVAPTAGLTQDQQAQLLAQQQQLQGQQLTQAQLQQQQAQQQQAQQVPQSGGS